MERAGLHTYLEGFVSVDEVRVYKPSPRVYRHLAARLDRPLEQVRLISSNSFDILGAAAVGMPVAWIDRSKGVFDTLGDPPEVAVTSLTELADALQARPG